MPRSVLSEEQQHSRVKNAVAHFLFGALIVPKIFFDAHWPSRKKGVDVLAVDRGVHVAVDQLIDRGHRELPIEPNYCGRRIETDMDDHIVVKVNEYDGEDAVVLEKREMINA